MKLIIQMNLDIICIVFSIRQAWFFLCAIKASCWLFVRNLSKLVTGSFKIVLKTN